MTDVCVIERDNPDAEPVRDPATGEWATPKTSVYTGKCEWVSPATSARAIDAQAQELVELRPIVKVPIAGSEGVRVGDIVRITAAAHDSALVGITARVAAPFLDTFATARRLPVEVTTGA